MLVKAEFEKHVPCKWQQTLLQQADDMTKCLPCAHFPSASAGGSVQLHPGILQGGHPAAHHAGHQLPPRAGALCGAAAPEDTAQSQPVGRRPCVWAGDEQAAHRVDERDAFNSCRRLLQQR